MIKEIIVVEGKDDICAVKHAVQAEVIATNGHGFPNDIKERIILASKQCGIIVLTDPDYAGERIRNEISKLVPDAKHAYIPQDEAIKNKDIGVENASKESIRNALLNAKSVILDSKNIFSMKDMIENDLTIGQNSKQRRILLGKKLGIGYGNAKQFLGRLNHYGITREQFEDALERINE